MGLAVVTVASGGLPIVESTVGGTPVTEATNGCGLPVTKVVGKPGIPVVFETIGMAAPVTYTTFNGVNSTQVTMTNGNLTATLNTLGSHYGARSAAVKTTGKYYFEVKAIDMSSACICGVLSSAGTYTNMQAGTSTTMLSAGNGQMVSNNAGNQGSPLGPIAVNDIVCWAIDLDGRKAWARKNGGTWNNNASGNPSTGTLGVNMTTAIDFAPAVCFAFSGQQLNDAWTANFGASAFAFAVPAGFTTGWPA